MCCKKNPVRDWIHQVSKQVLEMNVLQKNSVRDWIQGTSERVSDWNGLQNDWFGIELTEWLE